MTTDPTAVITRIVDELATAASSPGFDELIDELIDPDIVSHDPAEPAPIKGGDAYRTSMEAIRSTICPR